MTNTKEKKHNLFIIKRTGKFYNINMDTFVPDFVDATFFKSMESAEYNAKYLGEGVSTHMVKCSYHDFV